MEPKILNANSTHAALVVSDSSQILVETVATEKPGTGEILVSPLTVGICGTDLQIARRLRPDLATILGHEGIAEVVEIGTGVTDFSVGQKVSFNPVNPNNQNDILGHSSQGLFQQRLLISQSAIQRGLVVPFDTRVPLACGPLVEPLGTVVYGQSLVHQVCTPQHIVIVGAGPIGLLHALYARMQGCPKIFLVHTSRRRLAWAVERNIVRADEVFLDSPELERIIVEQTGGQGADATYMCTTRPSALYALRKALKYIRNDGCIDLVGGFSDGNKIANLPGVELNSVRRANFCGLPQVGVVTHHQTMEGKDVWLTGHRGTSENHLKVAMQLLHHHPNYFSSIISHIISWKAVPFIFECLVNKKLKQIEGNEYVKAIIDFTVKGSVVKSVEPSPLLLDPTFRTTKCSTDSSANSREYLDLNNNLIKKFLKLL